MNTSAILVVGVSLLIISCGILVSVSNSVGDWFLVSTTSIATCFHAMPRRAREEEAMSEEECICHYNPETGYRLDIVCSKHDGDFFVPMAETFAPKDTVKQLQQELREALEAEDDPQYAPSLEVIREICGPCIETEAHLCKPFPNPACGSCNGTGHVLMNWSKVPKGALAGALYYWAEQEFQKATGKETNFCCDLAVKLNECFSSDDPDLSALKAVLAAVLAAVASQPPGRP